MRNYIVLSILIIVLSSCYEKEEGCLNIRATNYGFEADVACEDCCTFPLMTMTVTHLWGDSTLRLDSVYTLDNGQEIRLVTAQFYLSDIAFTDGSSTETIVEEISVTGLDGVVRTIPDNFAFVQNLRFMNDIGTFDQAKDYDGLRMTFGIADNFLADDLVEDDQFFDAETLTYTNFQMTYVVESDTLTYSLAGPENTTEVIIAASLDLPLGVDFIIPLFVDYEKLFKNVDLDALSNGSADQDILSNISSFFGE